jgi:hypothetical protein
MSQPPCNLTLSVWAGQTFQDILTLQDSSGNPINLTGYTAEMQIRPYVQAPDPAFFTWTDTAGNIVLGGTAGTIAFDIASSVTAVMAQTAGVSDPNNEQVWVYDMILTSSGGISERVIQGQFLLFPGVTRPPAPTPAPSPWPSPWPPCCEWPTPTPSPT